MTNSMALWYKRWRETASDGEPAEVEVHLNLWRHTTSETTDSNFLDVGLLFSNAYEIGRICLFVPAVVKETEIEDLSERLRDDTLLSAVFNEVVKRTQPENDHSFATSCRQKHFLTFHSARVRQDFTVSPIRKTNSEQGMILEFRGDFCERLRAPGRHYIRLRFNLNDEAAAEFSTRKEARGHFFAPSLWREEFTEVRFNEVRNLPASVSSMIEEKDACMFNMTAAHCFLIRDMSFELMASHAAMHKMRRMEAKLWTGYLPTHLSKVELDKMMVYHWRGGKAPIESFISLARFRSPRDTLFYYLPGVVALGALGSALESWMETFDLPDSLGGAKMGGFEAMLVLAALALALFYLPDAVIWIWRKIDTLLRRLQLRR